MKLLMPIDLAPEHDAPKYVFVDMYYTVAKAYMNLMIAQEILDDIGVDTGKIQFHPYNISFLASIHPNWAKHLKNTDEYQILPDDITPGDIGVPYSPFSYDAVVCDAELTFGVYHSDDDRSITPNGLKIGDLQWVLSASVDEMKDSDYYIDPRVLMCP